MRDPQQEPPPRHQQATTWRRYLRFFGPRAVDDLDDELRFHVEMRVREYMARGMSEPEARAATARRLGDMASARAECVTIATRLQRRATRSQYVDNLRQDVAFAMRTLGRNKAWTAVAVITLALGIGANSAMFSVVYDLLLDPLPYPGADRIALLMQAPADESMPANVRITADAQHIAAWRQGARTIEALEPYSASDVTIERPGATPEVVRIASIQHTFAGFAGARAIVGRSFSQAEARGNAAVAMLSEPAWRSRYGGDPAVVGSVVRVNATPVTIIGVMSESLVLPQENKIQMWRPIDPMDEGLGFFAVVRMAKGATRHAVQQELDAISARLEQSESGKPRFRAVLQTPAELVSFRDSLVLLTAAVALVLLIACANVAHLLLARGASRQRELAIRSALGAGTGRLFRLLLTESAVLALAGCLGGVAVGWLGLRALIAARPEALDGLSVVRMDGATFTATAGIAALIALGFGVIGAIQAKRYASSETLKAGSLTTSASRRHGRARSLLVVTEMALCTMLLVAAALVLRSVQHLYSRDLGFRPDGMYALRANLPAERYGTAAAKQAFHSALLERLRALPGVEEISMASAHPTAMNYMIGALQREGDADPAGGGTALNPSNNVAADYFRFMGIRIVEGTTFTDTTAAAGQMIVNEALARRLWPGQSPVGRKLRLNYGGGGDWKTIVGVAANSMTAGLTSDRDAPMMYFPIGHSSFFRPQLLIRTGGDARIAGILAGLVQSIDPRLPPPGVRSIEDAMRSTAARPRFMLVLLGIFAALAVGLAAVGLYGVLAYTVALRTREIGIRMALGATRRVVARSVILQALAMAGAGAALGLLAARWGVKLVSHTLYGVPETDPVSFTAGALVLGAIAVVACLLPVRRAVSVDPMIAIRAD